MLNGTSQIPAEINNFYDRTLLKSAKPALLHRRWAQRRNLPKNSGTRTVKFRRYARLSTATTPLTEGVTPTGNTLSVTNLTATVYQYGDFLRLSDQVSTQTQDKLLKETAELLGEQAGETYDELARDVMVTGTNVLYGGVATSRATVQAGENITTTLLDKAINILDNGNARKITKMVTPDPGYESRPVNSCYVGIVHPNVAYTLQGLTGFIPVEKYANKADVMDNEIGSYKEIRFVKTTKAKVFSGAGASSINVYGTIILGADAYGDVGLGISESTTPNGMSEKKVMGVEFIYKGFGAGEDPLNQRQTTGWKGDYVTTILNDDFILRVETSVAFEG